MSIETLDPPPTNLAQRAPRAEASVGQRKKLLRLDALRGVAVVMVFAFHLGGQVVGWRDFDPVHPIQHVGDLLLYPITLGWMGVPLFFVLSGFVIHLSFRSYLRGTVAAFYRRRFWRIYPPYALVVVALLVIRPRPGEGTIEQLCSHLLLVHNFHPRTIDGINGSFWSIAAEAQFYLLYPLFMALRERVGIGRTVLTLAGIALACRLAVSIFAYRFQLISNEWAFLVLKSPAVCWFDWALGAYVAERYVGGRRAFRSDVARVGFAVCLLVCLVAPHFEGAFGLSFTAASLAAAFAIDRIAHGTAEPRWFERLVVPVGVVGYSFYLLHQPMISEMSRRVATVGLVGHFAPLGWAITLAVIFVASALMYRLVERPAQAIGKPRAPTLEILTPA